MNEPRRERITSPLTTARAHQPRSVRQEIDESTGVGQVYIRSLMRSQLRAALTVVASLAATVGLLPLLFALLPGLAGTSIGPIPAPWLVLGVAVYPALVLLGWLYVRFVERAEQDFAALVESSGHEDGP